VPPVRYYAHFATGASAVKTERTVADGNVLNGATASTAAASAPVDTTISTATTALSAAETAATAVTAAAVATAGAAAVSKKEMTRLQNCPGRVAPTQIAAAGRAAVWQAWRRFW
jgi:hypothetical protein